MPTEIILLAFIGAGFCAFAGTLYWVDLTPSPGMSSIPLQGLTADGANSRISVQPCPLPGSAAPTTAATGPPKLP